MDLFLVSLATALAVGNLVNVTWARKYAKVREINIRQGAKLAAAGEAEYHIGVRIRALEDTNIGFHNTILELKREGFEIPAKPPEYEGAPAVEIPREVKNAILEKAQPGEPLFNVLTRQAEDELAVEDSDPEQVATSIAKGSSYTPYE